MMVAAMMTGSSFWLMLSTIRLPMPGMEKSRSVVTMPASRMPKRMPTQVMTGSRALRMACFQMTVRSGTPLPRAVRT